MGGDIVARRVGNGLLADCHVRLDSLDPGSSASALYRGVVPIAPLRPGGVVVPKHIVSDEAESEECVRRTHTSLSMG